MTDETEFTPPTAEELAEIRREHAAYMEDYRITVSLEKYGPCGVAGCGHALAFHDPCSRCSSCSRFVPSTDLAIEDPKEYDS